MTASTIFYLFLTEVPIYYLAVSQSFSRWPWRLATVQALLLRELYYSFRAINVANSCRESLFPSCCSQSPKVMESFCLNQPSIQVMSTWICPASGTSKVLSIAVSNTRFPACRNAENVYEIQRKHNIYFLCVCLLWYTWLLNENELTNWPNATFRT